jgi:hypothetical protein
VRLGRLSLQQLSSKFNYFKLNKNIFFN